MKDFPARPLSKEERKEILIEANTLCRDHESNDLLFEIEQVLKERGFKPDYETIQLILDEE